MAAATLLRPVTGSSGCRATSEPLTCCCRRCSQSAAATTMDGRLDQARSLVCPLCLPPSLRTRGLTLPWASNGCLPGAAVQQAVGYICPVIPEPQNSPKPCAETLRWRCSKPGCKASAHEGVLSTIIDVTLGPNSIARTYLDLENACEKMVREMAADFATCTPHGLTSDGGASEITDATKRSCAVAALLGRKHWLVIVAEIMCLRGDLAHGLVDNQFARRLERIWDWISTHLGEDLGVTILGPQWILDVVTKLKSAARAVPADACRSKVFERALAARSISYPPISLELGSTRSQLAKSLQEKGVAVVDKILSYDNLKALIDQLEFLRRRGEMHCSGQPSDYRTDEIMSLDISQHAGLKHNAKNACNTLEGVCSILGGVAYTLQSEYDRANSSDKKYCSSRRRLIVPAQCMLASYSPANQIIPSGQKESFHLGKNDKTVGYVPHRDNDNESPSDRRTITAILYLNSPDWNIEQDGGALRLFLDADIEDNTGVTASNIVELSPVGGRLVVFDSRKMLHEVRPPLRNRRWAVTLWIEEAEETMPLLSNAYGVCAQKPRQLGRQAQLTKMADRWRNRLGEGNCVYAAETIQQHNILTGLPALHSQQQLATQHIERSDAPPSVTLHKCGSICSDQLDMFEHWPARLTW